MDHILPPKVWHSWLVCNGRSEFDIHIKTSIPGLDLPPLFYFVCATALAYPSPK